MVSAFGSIMQNSLIQRACARMGRPGINHHSVPISRLTAIPQQNEFVRVTVWQLHTHAVDRVIHAAALQCCSCNSCMDRAIAPLKLLRAFERASAAAPRVLLIGQVHSSPAFSAGIDNLCALITGT
ncbi:AICAR transformylase/IMP cyclohydrolase PurH [Pseudomonas syringae pv. actinidiae]|uniref:AICAR transformylase/IMP cyclohydrolase PurH n=1 Tax=Pseudomonas syringae pv. actinidiae TaxID=103796 RepID=A0A2V0R4S5_PSESF|nr:AICAR transformylase/IMP cyclohydrolase PurH [Pseudomonas syringae pv. actinidiae]GBH17465.1 AICAR transformylase/IMP cyclohydrolase PurH [Pseudomonas syringae pv. actinidiae]